jgi:hypothetical protein
MYDAYTGELIWSVYETIEKSPSFPLFSTDYEIMAGAEIHIARRIVSHLMPPPPCEEEREGCSGCDG